jgi:anthranilate phosphoribosyltransferase
MIKEAIHSLVSGEEVAGDVAHVVALEILSGEATACQIASFLTALRIRGEKTEHVVAFVRAMREKATRIARPDGVVLDTCGTGGDASGSFNISTTAMFITAAAGVRVAKHGNRAMSSRCGSADVLAAAGVKIDCAPEVSERCLREIGVCFLFAPAYHSAMKHAVTPRREIGHRTIFNMAGPLSNPAGATHQLIGVYDPALCRMFAEVLRELGTVRALIAHGADGLDEISICNRTSLIELRDGAIREWSVGPEDFGLNGAGNLSDLQARGGPDESAALMSAILRGEETGPKAQIALANAAAALYVAGMTETIRASMALARETVKSGAAHEKLQQLVGMTNVET